MATTATKTLWPCNHMLFVHKTHGGLFYLTLSGAKLLLYQQEKGDFLEIFSMLEYHRDTVDPIGILESIGKW